MTSSSRLSVVFVATLASLAGCGGKVVVDGTSSMGGGATSTSSSSSSVGGTTSSGPPPIAVCGPNELGILGSLDGQPLSYSVAEYGSFVWTGGLNLFAGTSAGQLVFFTNGPPAGDGQHTDAGFIGIPILPPEQQTPLNNHAGLWLCQAPGPTLQIDPGTGALASAAFSALRSLGACPGKPVSGYLASCKGAKPDCSNGDLVGTVNGQAVHAVFGGSFNDVEILYEGQGLLVPGADLSPYVFIMPQGNADAGAVYCIGGQDAGKLTSLSRLGTCGEAAPIQGSLSVCFVP